MAGFKPFSRSYILSRYIVLVKEGSKMQAFGVFNTQEGAKLAAADVKGKVYPLKAIPIRKGGAA